MLDPDLFGAWLNAVPTELNIPFEHGPRVREFGAADVTGLFTLLEGPGDSLEGVGDHISFQLRATAREYQQNALYRSFRTVDDALRFGDYPADLWGTWIVSVSRSGGAPSELPTDEHDRVSYVCTYNAFETI